jgi:hypothetical protein
LFCSFFLLKNRLISDVEREKYKSDLKNKELCDYIFGNTPVVVASSGTFILPSRGEEWGGTHSARLIESFCEERDLNFYDRREIKMEVLFVVNKRSNKLTVSVRK